MFKNESEFVHSLTKNYMYMCNYCLANLELGLQLVIFGIFKIPHVKNSTSLPNFGPACICCLGVTPGE